MKRIMLILAAGLISFGCGGSSNESVNQANAPAANTETNTNVEQPEKPTFTAGANPKDDVISSTQKLQDVPFWSATIRSEINPELDAEMAYAAPDRYHIKKKDGEVVIIGRDSWVREGGSWEKIEEDIGELIRAQIVEATEDAIENLKDVQITGKEMINGKEASIYTHQEDGVVTRVWIANDSGLQLRNEIEVTEGGTSKKQTTVYNYENPVKIEAPQTK